jgi:hypothetical protein
MFFYLKQYEINFLNIVFDDFDILILKIKKIIIFFNIFLIKKYFSKILIITMINSVWWKYNTPSSTNKEIKKLFEFFIFKDIKTRGIAIDN